ncbi:MAG: hypothetical protein GY913_17735 [Proteobacteria bacterium]|nr:hypothetical protein [Pseudomonadota bacterium]MCP4918748.1 hypothetical protein [Pseudomonadota bacterium]
MTVRIARLFIACAHVLLAWADRLIPRVVEPPSVPPALRARRSILPMPCPPPRRPTLPSLGEEPTVLVMRSLSSADSPTVLMDPVGILELLED